MSIPNYLRIVKKLKCGPILKFKTFLVSNFTRYEWIEYFIHVKNFIFVDLHVKSYNIYTPTC